MVTSLLYAMDKIANTVGHYDAYRKNVDFEKKLILNVLLPEETINSNNICYNLDANELIKTIKGDLLYLDPPYNSRQYCDAYHLLENMTSFAFFPLVVVMPGPVPCPPTSGRRR